MTVPECEDLPYNMCSSLITFTQHIEQEQVHIIEQSLMIQEQLCQVAQVLAEELLLLAVYLKHGHIGVAIDLIPRWVLDPAALQMLKHLLALLEEHEVILTEIQHLQLKTRVRST
jgi:hypothetical protein